jgi:hypothetical protein
MTINEMRSSGPAMPLSDRKFQNAHWLPFAADKKVIDMNCDVEAYFVVEGDEKSMKSTFRGRNLQGVQLDLGEFEWYGIGSTPYSLHS